MLVAWPWRGTGSCPGDLRRQPTSWPASALQPGPPLLAGARAAAAAEQARDWLERCSWPSGTPAALWCGCWSAGVGASGRRDCSRRPFSWPCLTFADSLQGVLPETCPVARKPQEVASVFLRQASPGRGRAPSRSGCALVWLGAFLSSFIKRGSRTPGNCLLLRSKGRPGSVAPALSYTWQHDFFFFFFFGNLMKTSPLVTDGSCNSLFLSEGETLRNLDCLLVALFGGAQGLGRVTASSGVRTRQSFKQVPEFSGNTEPPLGERCPDGDSDCTSGFPLG